MLDTVKENPTAQWPAVELAYGYVPNSYDFAARRIDAIENRLRAFGTASASFLLAGPVLVHLAWDSADMHSVMLLAAALCCLGCIVATVIGQIGTVILSPSIEVMQQQMLHLDHWHFQDAMLQSAVKGFRHNRAIVNRKGHAADTAGALLLGQIILLSLWAIQQAL